MMQQLLDDTQRYSFTNLDELLLTVKEAAKFPGVSPQTLQAVLTLAIADFNCAFLIPDLLPSAREVPGIPRAWVA